MQDQHTLAFGGDVHQFIADLDAAEIEVDELADHFIVVAGHEDDIGALLGLLQDRLHHVVVALVPVPATLQLPAVDDVAHQVERLGFGGTQKFQQSLGLAAGSAQVDVGNPDGAKAQRIALGFVIMLVAIGTQVGEQPLGFFHELFAWLHAVLDSLR